MKALIVGICLLLCNASVNAQQAYHAFATGVESYDGTSGTWFNDKSFSVDLTIRVEKESLTVEDKKKSKYLLQDKLPYVSVSQYLSTTGWGALDKNGKKCYIVVTNYHTDPVKMRISFSYKINDKSRTYYDVLPM